MYIHLGEEVIVKAKDIIAILDKESFNSSTYMEKFFHQEDSSVQLAKGSFKSIIVTSKQIYFSPLASSTLKKRSQKLSVQEF